MAKNHINIPLRKKTSQKNENPIGINNISVTDTGIVRIGKGAVYMDINAHKEDSDVFYMKIVVRDEYGNFVEMTRHSDEDDIIPDNNSVYESNQTINDKPYLSERKVPAIVNAQAVGLTSETLGTVNRIAYFPLTRMKKTTTD